MHSPPLWHRYSGDPLHPRRPVVSRISNLKKHNRSGTRGRWQPSRVLRRLRQPVLVEDNSDHGYEYPGRIVGPAQYGPSGEIVHLVRIELTGDLFLVSHEAMYAPDRVDHRWEPLEPTTPLTKANSPLMMHFTGWYRYFESQGGTVRDRRW